MGKQMVVPIGLESIRQEVETVCARARIYQKLEIRPNSLIVPLEAGNGRTMLLEYVADMYQAFGVMDFFGSPDPYLEISLDRPFPPSVKRRYIPISIPMWWAWMFRRWRSI